MREATLIETLEPRIILSASLEALDDVIVQSTVNPTGQVTALFRNVAGRPTLLQASDAATEWSASDLLAEVGLSEARADTTIFTDPRTGRTSIALISGETLYLAEQQVDGSWVATDLTAAASATESPLRSLTSFVSIGNPNLNTRADDRIHIAGVSLAGDMLLFRQQVDAEGFVVEGWETTNLTTGDIASRGGTAPQLVGPITSYVTSWNGLNIVGLDAGGSIQSFWWAPNLGDRWASADLTRLYGAPQYTGKVDVFLTAWNAINIVGVTTDGDVVATWWLPSFQGTWRTENYTERFGGPSLTSTSISSYVIDAWGGLNIVGLTEDQDLFAYWWSPARTGLGWGTVNLTEQNNITESIAAVVQGSASPTGTVHLFGVSQTGQVVRYGWKPGSPWAGQNVSRLGTPPAEDPSLQVLELGQQQILQDSSETLRFSAAVPFATPGTTINLYNSDPSGSTPDAGLFGTMFDTGTNGDAEAGDGIYTFATPVSYATPGTRYFAARLAGSEQVVTAELRVVAPPTMERLMEIDAQATQIVLDIERETSTGVETGLALANIAEILRNATGVDTSSVRVTDEGLYWSTDEGIPSVVFANESDYENTQARGGLGGDSFNPPPASITVSTPDLPPPSVNLAGETGLVLGAYFHQFENGGGDESNDMAAIFANAGMNVTEKYRTTAGSNEITVEDFKNLEQYSGVVITSHAALFPQTGVVVDTGQAITADNLTTYLADLLAGRLAWSGTLSTGTYAITPDFIDQYTGQMENAIIYIGACKTAAARSMAEAFFRKGAFGFIGYTDIVRSSFATANGIQAALHFANNGDIETIPGINTNVEPQPDLTPARFVSLGNLGNFQTDFDLDGIVSVITLGGVPIGPGIDFETTAVTFALFPLEMGDEGLIDIEGESAGFGTGIVGETSSITLGYTTVGSGTDEIPNFALIDLQDLYDRGLFYMVDGEEKLYIDVQGGFVTEDPTLEDLDSAPFDLQLYSFLTTVSPSGPFQNDVIGLSDNDSTVKVGIDNLSAGWLLGTLIITAIDPETGQFSVEWERADPQGQYFGA